MVVWESLWLATSAMTRRFTLQLGLYFLLSTRLDPKTARRRSLAPKRVNAGSFSFALLYSQNLSPFST